LFSVKTVVREGIPSEEILKVAEEENAELIIMGCNGTKGLQRLVTGCVSKDVERSSKVPVLVAKGTTEEEACGLTEAAITV
jgi:nucleotide-binding universal stress UspA family protein